MPVRRTLLTHGCCHRRYCCVYVDKFDVIESITYLGTECLEWSNLMRVVGMPQVR
jgi:hypothetical protein